MCDTLKSRINEALHEVPLTRTNDNILFGEIVKRRIPLFPEYETELSTVAEVFTNSKKYGLPSYTTLIRERREIQKKNPEVVDDLTATKRADLEVDFRNEYGKGRGRKT